MDKVYIDPTDHTLCVIWLAASYKAPLILMNEIPVDDFEKGTILCPVKPNGENMIHIVVW